MANDEEHEKPTTPEAAEESSGSADATNAKKSEDTTAKRPSKTKTWWTKAKAFLDLNPFTLMMMAKGGLPPAIALALIQVDVIANHFTTIGYLIAIVSILGMCIMPRAKFIQTMFVDIVIICFASAVNLLVIFCVTQARKHTSSTPQELQAYNSSASAVAAIWLFFQIYVVNCLKAKFPALQLPVILYSIFAVVTSTYAPNFPTMSYGIGFIKKLLEAFLAGFAIATAVSFLVLPVTMRTVVMKSMLAYLELLKKVLRSYQAYLTSLEDPANLQAAILTEPDEDFKPTSEAAALKATAAGVTALHGKLQGDLPFAKREIAYGRMGPEELSTVNKRLRRIMMPSLGLTALMSLLERLANFHNWTHKRLKEGLPPEEEELRKKSVQDWSRGIKALHEPFADILDAACDGIDHAALQLRFTKPPKAKKSAAEDDVEAEAEGTRPGDKGFAEYLEKKIDAFYSGKRELLEHWCQRHGIDLPAGFFDDPETSTWTEQKARANESFHTRVRNQRQLYLLLYMEFLLWSAAKSILALVKYSDELVENGTMGKNKLILPGWRRFKKFLMTIPTRGEGYNDDTRDLADVNRPSVVVDFGRGYNKSKDPEHLPPRNMFEKAGDALRKISHFLGSSESAFGFRVAVATMSIAIVAYLNASHTWFQYHRVLWAEIMVAISMAPSSGQSTFGFILRVFGTIVAMALSYCIYYIPDKHTAGVIVFLWFFVSLGFWIPLKKPQMTIVGIISIVTATLIVGYTVEVEKIGVQVAASNGQEYLPLYLLAPWRLAAVTFGLAVAFVFTIFPYPISEHSLLRQNVGGSLYLLANYYSIVHETIQMRIKDAEGDPNDKNSPSAKMSKIRAKVYTKQALMLTSMETYQNFIKFEIPVGGRFPKKQYDTIVNSINHIMRYISLLSYSSATISSDPEGLDLDHHLSQWSKDLKTVLSSVSHTSHEITSLLTLLSHSMTNGQPLPPYLQAPQPYNLSERLEHLDPDLLSLRHVNEPEYATFAVFQVAARCIVYELRVLLENVKELVGELDFSFHIVSSASSSSTAVDGETYNGEPVRFPSSRSQKSKDD